METAKSVPRIHVRPCNMLSKTVRRFDRLGNFSDRLETLLTTPKLTQHGPKLVEDY
jgi:hypothetical protein